MKIIIYAENLLGSIGGAEVYSLKLAEVLKKNNDLIILTLKNKKSNRDLEEIFKRCNSSEFVVKTLWFSHKKNLLFEIPNRVILWARIRNIIKSECDVFINCYHNRLIADKRKICIHLIHFPYRNYQRFFPGFIGKILDSAYRKSYSAFISNSEFTKEHLKKEWHVDSTVIYPPINMNFFDNSIYDEKVNQFIMVGRIVPEKKIMEILNWFISVCKMDLFKSFRFIVAGNMDKSHLTYFNSIKVLTDKSEGQISVMTDVPYDKLVELYKKSLFFIHAKGYLEDENVNPMLMEHFGMTTVEAMANACIPLVINKAGQCEIVENGINGFLWNDVSEISGIVSDIISDSAKISFLQRNAVEKAKKYSIPEFNKNIENFFNNLIQN